LAEASHSWPSPFLSASDGWSEGQSVIFGEGWYDGVVK